MSTFEQAMTRPRTMREAFQATDIPAGKSGNVRIEKFEVSKSAAGFHNIRSHGISHMSPGQYTRLIVNGGVMMSDTDMEYRTNLEAITSARGYALIMGLGLGYVIRAIAARERYDTSPLDKWVRSITVIEKSQDVIDLVLPHLKDLPFNLEVIHADALAFVPSKGMRFDFIYHDIWPESDVDNLTEISKLKRRWGRRCDEQAAWTEERLRKLARQDRAEDRRDRGYWS